jgi:hypothetical protein
MKPSNTQQSFLQLTELELSIGAYENILNSHNAKVEETCIKEYKKRLVLVTEISRIHKEVVQHVRALGDIHLSYRARFKLMYGSSVQTQAFAFYTELFLLRVAVSNHRLLRYHCVQPRCKPYNPEDKKLILNVSKQFEACMLPVGHVFLPSVNDATNRFERDYL